MGQILRWGSLQLCRSLMNGLYLNLNASYLLDIVEFASLRTECEQQIGQLIAHSKSSFYTS